MSCRAALYPHYLRRAVSPAYAAAKVVRQPLRRVSGDADPCGPRFRRCGKYAKTEYKKAVKKTVTIPRWMNDAAVARRLNFSRLLQRALLRELGVPNGEARKRRRERLKVWCGLGLDPREEPDQDV